MLTVYQELPDSGEVWGSGHGGFPWVFGIFEFYTWWRSNQVCTDLHWTALWFQVGMSHSHIAELFSQYQQRGVGDENPKVVAGIRNSIQRGWDRRSSSCESRSTQQSVQLSRQGG